jgi:hypothetical protein
LTSLAVHRQPFHEPAELLSATRLAGPDEMTDTDISTGFLVQRANTSSLTNNAAEDQLLTEQSQRPHCYSKM